MVDYLKMGDKEGSTVQAGPAPGPLIELGLWTPSTLPFQTLSSAWER